MPIRISRGILPIFIFAGQFGAWHGLGDHVLEAARLFDYQRVADVINDQV
ncbi:hypothetical protein [Haloarcula rubripromontorii]|nr:hypothetical protein [Haloarcula rubripromontorii]